MNMKGKNQTLIIFEVYFDSTERSEGEGDQKLTNQFSYVERATQTMNNTLKVIPILMVAMLMSRVLYSVIVVEIVFMSLALKVLLEDLRPMITIPSTHSIEDDLS